MVTNTTLLLIVMVLASVTAQTFQYSRGWTNGKRDGHRRSEDPRDIANNLEKILSPCQMSKLRYVLEGKPLTERVNASKQTGAGTVKMYVPTLWYYGALNFLGLRSEPCRITPESIEDEELLVPCDYDDETENPKRYKNDRNQEPLFEVFQ